MGPCIILLQHEMPAHTITPPPPWATPSTTLTSENRSSTQRHTCCLPSALNSVNRDSSVKRTLLQRPRRHRICPSGWSQTMLEVNMLDVEVQGWCGYTWSVLVRLVGCTAKFSENPLETAY
ncbi:uncharacterized protein LOC129190083 isoform X3 [Dunckerocampus dactyliophorus]|uniref:uncharacterized protein LOC129190083 isoform X3 n=1 Tax=Dunckerocampus dactyliophorus TaxID=161453 RepID=UPI0024075722|nr:uncharacterized protein LOC129190083 isoform X3 [Dunckerocampus dactyliophorus]